MRQTRGFQNRKAAQAGLQRVLRDFPYSYHHVADDMLAALAPDSNVSHAQLKVCTVGVR